MKMYRKYLLNALVVFVFTLVLSALPVSATVISYTTADLANGTDGKDLWSATFTVNDVAFSTGEGLQVFFDFGLYDDITYVSGQNVADLKQFEISNPSEVFGVQKNGWVDAQANVTTTRSFAFTVNYSWSGSPGTVPGTFDRFDFEIYNSDLAVTASGVVSEASSPNSPVPEPASMMLLGVGLLGLAGTLRNKKS